MKSTYGTTFCLLAGTTLFTGCLTPAEQAPKQQEEMMTAPMVQEQPIAAEPSNTAAVHHGVVELGSEAQFAKAIAHGNVIVDVFATWCGPCKKLAPELDALAGELGTKVQFIKVDADKFPSITRQLQVENFPTLVFFKDGKKIHTKVGGATRSSLKELILKTFGL